MRVHPRTWWAAWWIAIPVALAAAASYPIIYNYFFGDDLVSLYDVANKPLLELLIVPYGGHLCIVRNAVLRLLFRFFGPDPAPYYWVALLTHLLNVALLCLLVRALTGSERLACFGAVLWGTAPVAESTIGWCSVHGQVLSTTAQLLVLIGIVRAGRRAAVSRWALATWALLVFVASTSFGIGLAFAVVLPIVAWLLMPAGATRRRAIQLCTATAAGMVAIYAAARHIAAVHYESPANPFAIGPVDTLRHWAGVADLTFGMLAYGTEQLVLGAFAHLAPGLLWPVVVALPVLGLIALGFRTGTASARRAMAAFALLAAATYAVIAAGRLTFYPEFKRLLVSTGRYHYAGPFAMTVVLCLALAESELGRSAGAWVRNMALMLGVTVTTAALILVRPPYLHFLWELRYTNLTLNGMQGLIRAASPGSDVYIENEPFHGVGPFALGNPRMYPGLAALFVVYYPSNVVDGHRVFFVEPDAGVRDVARRGMRSQTLLVAPDDVPPQHEVGRVPPPPTPARRAPQGGSAAPTKD